jgi:hypothetical protein
VSECDAGNMVLRNSGIQSPHYMAQQPRKPQILSVHKFYKLFQFISIPQTVKPLMLTTRMIQSQKSVQRRGTNSEVLPVIYICNTVHNYERPLSNTEHHMDLPFPDNIQKLTFLHIDSVTYHACCKLMGLHQ